MLTIVQFENGKYGLQNSWTGIILPHEFRTAKAAARKGRRITKRFNKTIGSISNSLKENHEHR